MQRPEPPCEDIAASAGASESSDVGLSLADLAGQAPANDWTSLPLSLLGDIFTRLLEHTGSLDATVRLWQGLALVCKSWLLALRESTPLCLELTKPEHLSATARSWLSRVPLEVLVLARTMALPPGADCQLLAGEAFQARSAPLLRSLMHASPEALPLLHSFSRLKQVALFCAENSQPARHIEAAAFHQLPKLNCLTVAGYWGALDTAELPTRLKHLALSNYNEGHTVDVVLPPGMKQLEVLSVRADSVILDWVDVCQRCDEVHVAAALVLLGVGPEPIARLAREVGYENVQGHLYKRVSSAMAEGEHFAQATLAFFDLALYSGPAVRDRSVVPIEPDDFLQVLRDDLLPVNIDVNPALEVFGEFVRDVPSPDACFVLELVKQEAGKPLSMHFTTPVTDSEIKLLTSKPVWRISWCEDPRAAQVLADPQFLRHSAGTLTDLLSIPLVPGLDLRPFTKLVSLLGHVKSDNLAPTLRRMPPGLESLCLTTEGGEEPRDFDAGVVRHLRKLKELSLYGHRRHNLAELSRRVNMIRILNPLVAEGEVIGTGAKYRWPLRGTGNNGSGGGSGSDSDSGGSSEGEWDTEEEEEEQEDEGWESGVEGEGGSEASRDSFYSGISELQQGSAEAATSGGSPARAAKPAPTPAAEPAAAAGSAARAAGEQSEVPATSAGELQGAVAPATSEESALAALAALATAAPTDDAASDHASSSSSSSSSGSEEYEDALHGHGHRHGGGGGGEEERHSKQACQDPFCPLHSGKSFLQISLTDHRLQSTINFSALLAAGFKMLTITLSAELPQARCTLLHEGNWRSALAALQTSDIEVLELNCQAATMAFRSSSLLHRLAEVPVETAMRYVAEHYGDVWQVKSWNGNTAADGVLEGSRGYALMRRSVAEAAQNAALAE
ncbi:hypothetical protein D9Q98_010005 [Chlorella vulgaris]|uniref:Uncharacterized protein n=1 Tax=Chlorella vulgaris TaxID=3077 RepID=A0A9D4TFW0_CHLVU|nr:hypothetical protein D9Q98_010005 [Chlorella vulgaris]